MTTLFTSLTNKDKKEAVERLIADGTPRHDFFLMIVLSVCMATFGLILNNSSVIIGSMLIAPLLSPILGIGMGVVMADRKLIVRSTMTTLKSTAFAILTATVIALFFSKIGGLGSQLNSEIMARLEPNLVSGLIALVAGCAASYALIKPQLSATLPGVAVSASLVPPLAVTGIGIARFNWTIISDSFVLFLVNVTLIIFAGSVIFSLMRLYAEQPVAERAIKKEDDQLKKDIDQAKKEAEAAKKD